MDVAVNTQSKLSPNSAPALDNSVVEFWDVGEGASPGEALDHNAAINDEFTGLNTAKPQGNKYLNSLTYLLFFLFLVPVLWGLYLFFIEEREPITEAREWIAQLFGDSSNENQALDEPTPSFSASPSEPPQPSVEKSSKIVQGNPYWHLPNAILGSQIKNSMAMDRNDEEVWRKGLAHRFPYQRWKTIQEIRKKKLQGSHTLLWLALEDKKFWMRGFAAVGLSEFNIPISLQILDNAIKNARSELVADFFERFIKRCNPGQCYVLRQAIRIMDPKGRLIALEGIARSKDSLRDLYVVAASLDPSPKVVAFAQKAIQRLRIGNDKSKEMMEIIEGKKEGTYLIAGANLLPEKHAIKASKDSSEDPASVKKLEPENQKTADKDLEQFDQKLEDTSFIESGSEDL